MLSSIHPLGERGKGNRFGTTATAYVIGSIIGGSLTGALFGTIGWAVPLGQSGRLGLLAATAIVALWADLSGRRLPSLQRQVNEEWLVAYRGWVYGLGFGIQLGTGLLTFITAAAIVLWLGAMVAVGSWPAAIAIGTTFGLVRGLSILMARRITSPERLQRFFRRLHATAPAIRRVCVGTLAVLTMISVALTVVSATTAGREESLPDTYDSLGTHDG